ncbi:MAG: hypothetical protein ACP5NF_10015 [Thermoanaerobaculum sp.]
MTKVFSIGAHEPRLSLPEPGPWQVEVREPSLWPSALVLPSPVPPGTEVRFWWKAEVALTTEGPENSPEGLQVFLFPPPQGEGSPVTLACEGQGLRWRCPAPAGRWRVKIVVPGFAAVRREELELKPGGISEVRLSSLIPEAKLTGALSPVPQKPLTLSLLPVKAALPAPGPVDDRFYWEEARTDERGAFAFSGLAAGTYELQLASACGPRLARIVLAPGSQASLPNLGVACGGPLRVRVSPHLEGTWDVLVFAENEGGGVATPVVTGHVAGGETWVSGPLPEASYSVVLHNARGEALSADEVWLGAQGATVEFGLEGFVARGRVLRGDNPWEGRFRFQKVGKGVFEVHVTTDREGRFSVYLPQKGRWLASPFSESFRFDGGVELEASPGRTLTVGFPATRLSGRLLGVTPASGPVFLYLVDKAYASIGSYVVGGDGSFDVQGLPEGEYWLQGVGPSAVTAVATVSLAQGKPVVQDFTLLPVLFLELAVTDGEKPVAGAFVHFRPFASGFPVQLLPPEPVVSDSRGMARLPVPLQAAELQGAVFAPPFAVHVFSARAPWPSSLRVSLDQRAGTIVLPEKLVVGESEQERTYLLPVIGGHVLDIFQEIATWRGTYGTPPDLEGTVLAMAPPGQHLLCRVTAERLFETVTMGQPPPDLRCSSGTLAKGGLLRLQAP